MLFNSYAFIFLFLPITLFVFFQIGIRGHRHLAIAWLVAASLFFYGWWNPIYIILLIVSILVNFTIGTAIFSKISGSDISLKKILLVIGISFNLLLLGYFKYTNFFINNLNLISGTSFQIEKILLPLAISLW